MKVLHILVDGRAEDADRIIEAQSADHEVKVVDLSQGRVSYDALVDAIFYCDKVICW